MPDEALTEIEVRDRRIAELESALNDPQSYYKRMVSAAMADAQQVVKQDQRIKELESENEDLKRDVSNLEAGINAQDQALTADINKHVATIQSLQAQLRSEKSEKLEWMSNSATHSAELADLRIEYEKVERQSNKYWKQRDHYKQQVCNSRERIVELESQLAEARRRLKEQDLKLNNRIDDEIHAHIENATNLRQRLAASQELEEELLEALKLAREVIGEECSCDMCVRLASTVNAAIAKAEGKQPGCDCHKHERQVCDVCQGVTDRESIDAAMVTAENPEVPTE